MTRAGNQLNTHVLELMAPLGPVAARRFFGGTGFTFAGTLFAMLMGETLFMRVDARNRARFEEAGSLPFSYATRKGRVTVETFLALPGELLDDPDAMLDWARDSIAAAQANKRPSRPKAAARPRADPTKSPRRFKRL